MTESRGGSQSFYHMFFRSLALVQLHTRHQTNCYIGALIASHHRSRTKAGAPAEIEPVLSQLEPQSHQSVKTKKSSHFSKEQLMCEEKI